MISQIQLRSEVFDLKSFISQFDADDFTSNLDFVSFAHFDKQIP